jgi:hypothetical protein
MNSFKNLPILIINRIFGYIIFIFWPIFLIGQGGGKANDFVIQNYKPASPSVYAFSKYIENPVNLYNGVPLINIPIYSSKIDDINLDIQLSYHAGGIRVSEESGWVGLGWDLSFGNIVQTINDRNDLAPEVELKKPDWIESPFLTEFPRKFYNTSFQMINPGYSQPIPVIPSKEYYSYKAAVAHPLSISTPGIQMYCNTFLGHRYIFPVNGITTNEQLNFDIIHSLNIDSEPDIFIASFFGHELKFIVESKNPLRFKILNSEAYKISYSESGSFEILTPFGEYFQFSQKELINSWTKQSAITPQPQGELSSVVWYISKIISRYKKEITFNYDNYLNANNNPNFSQSFAYLQSTNTGISNYVSESIVYGFLYQNQVRTIETGSNQNRIVLKSIATPTENIYFETSERVDMHQAKKLDNIRVESGGVVKSFKLNFEYFDAISDVSNFFDPGSAFQEKNRLRLKLKDVTDIFGGKYFFTYNDAGSLPRKTSFAQDFWGYYNGADGNNSTIPNPQVLHNSQLVNNLPLPTIPNNLGANFEKCKYGTLSSIQLPTGGRKEFEYELNSFDNNILPDFTGINSAFTNGNGLRIKRIKYYSGYSINSLDLVDEYEYYGGKALIPLKLLKQSQFSNYSFGSINNFIFLELNSKGFFSTNPLSSGNRIGYSKVKKNMRGNTGISNGSTSFEFINNVDRVDFLSVTSPVQFNLPSTKFISQNVNNPGLSNTPENGSLLLEETFDRVSNTVKRIEFMYETKLSSINYGVKIFQAADFMFNCHNDVGGTQLTTQLSVPVVYFGYYPIYEITTLQKEAKTTYFNQGLEYVERQYTNYNNYNFPTYKSTLFSNGEELQENIYYSWDYYSRTGNAILLNENLHGIVTGNYLRKYKPSLTPNYPWIFLKKIENEYIKVGNKVYMDQAKEYFNENSTLPSNQIVFKEFSNLVSKPNLIEKNDEKVAFIWDRFGNLICEAVNANYGDLGFSSFEDNEDIIQSNLAFNGSGINDLSAPTGSKIFRFSGNNAIIKNELNPSRKYTLTYWINNQNAYLLSGVMEESGYPKVLTSRNGWYLIEHKFSGVSSISLYKENANIDELRIFPISAQLKTFAYQLGKGLVCETDPACKTLYYEYDSFNRLMHLKDQNSNIIKKYCYNYAGQPINCNGQTFTNTEGYSGQFQKIGCTTGFVGSTVTYTVPVGSVTSSQSIDHANLLAQAKVNAEGQAYANANGICTPLSTCTPSICQAQGLDYKCVRGVCEQAFPIFTGVEIMINNVPHCEYYYEWSDLSRSYHSIPSGGSTCVMSF